jgi:hypothetical protein
METGITGQKGGITAPKFHFQRLFRWKQRREIKAFDYGRKLINQIGRRRNRRQQAVQLRGELCLIVWIQQRMRLAQLERAQT